MGVAGLPEAAKGPSFSAVAGLMIYPQIAGYERPVFKGVSHTLKTGTGGRFARVGQWIRDSF
jgi:cell division protein FtsA